MTTTVDSSNFIDTVGRDGKVIHDDTLLMRLGGEDILDCLILSFYDRILQDPQLQPFFGGIDVQ